uniref:Uncharacterized protein n=1 Tax=Arundo donax TaxID=35708 RepID=A0A0A9GQF4_ARUDO
MMEYIPQMQEYKESVDAWIRFCPTYVGHSYVVKHMLAEHLPTVVSLDVNHIHLLHLGFQFHLHAHFQ